MVAKLEDQLTSARLLEFPEYVKDKFNGTFFNEFLKKLDNKYI